MFYNSNNFIVYYFCCCCCLKEKVQDFNDFDCEIVTVFRLSMRTKITQINDIIQL